MVSKPWKKQKQRQKMQLSAADTLGNKKLSGTLFLSFITCVTSQGEPKHSALKY